MKIRDIRQLLALCDDMRQHPNKHPNTAIIHKDSLFIIADEITKLRAKVRELNIRARTNSEEL